MQETTNWSPSIRLKRLSLCLSDISENDLSKQGEEFIDQLKNVSSQVNQLLNQSSLILNRKSENNDLNGSKYGRVLDEIVISDDENDLVAEPKEANHSRNEKRQIADEESDGSQMDNRKRHRSCESNDSKDDGYMITTRYQILDKNDLTFASHYEAILSELEMKSSNEIESDENSSCQMKAESEEVYQDKNVDNNQTNDVLNIQTCNNYTNELDESSSSTICDGVLHFEDSEEEGDDSIFNDKSYNLDDLSLNERVKLIEQIRETAIKFKNFRRDFEDGPITLREASRELSNFIKCDKSKIYRFEGLYEDPQTLRNRNTTLRSALETKEAVEKYMSMKTGKRISCKRSNEKVKKVHNEVESARSKRTSFRKKQLRILKKYFRKEKYPSDNDIAALRQQIGHSKQDIKRWFNNNRYKSRTC